MKSFAKICLVLVTAVVMAASTTHAQTDSSTTTTNNPPAPAKPKSKPYSGVVASVDSVAKIFTVTSASGTSKTLHVTSMTRIKKDGVPATFADVAVGDKVKGAERKDDSGNMVARTINIGDATPKTSPPPAAADKQ
jgi:hypothetical protein